ncbi:MAG: hypothetical protein C0497_12665 [Gemmatimonas sp.]|nr:hypothetical protein [Gemmatimonas sp.]
MQFRPAQQNHLSPVGPCRSSSARRWPYRESLRTRRRRRQRRPQAPRRASDNAPFDEGLTTRRADIGALARWVVQDSSSVLRGAILTFRGSAVEQRHRHQFGRARESDGHCTWFAEAAIAVPRGRVSYVGGVALQQDSYRAQDVAGFDYTFTVPAAFGQVDLDPAPWIALSTSARADAHSEYGTVVNPRISVLLRRPDGVLAGWSSRFSLGTGEFAPSPFTETTEATGVSPLLPLENLAAERATSGSIDIGGPLQLAMGRVELNATAFASRVSHPVQVIDAEGTTPFGATRIRLANAAQPTRTWGLELLGRFVRELGEEVDGVEVPALRVTGTYTFLRSTECDPGAAGGGDACARRLVPLTPRHTAGVVAAERPADAVRPAAAPDAWTGRSVDDRCVGGTDRVHHECRGAFRVLISASRDLRALRISVPSVL